MTKQKYFKKKIINQTEVDAFTQKQNECLKIGDVEWVKNIIQKLFFNDDLHTPVFHLPLRCAVVCCRELISAALNGKGTAAQAAF